MVNIRYLVNHAKCYQSVRTMRGPQGVICPHCSSDSVIKDGKDETEPQRQRYLCHGCRRRFDDLTGMIFAGHHEPLRTWIICLYFIGLNLSSLQIPHELRPCGTRLGGPIGYIVGNRLHKLTSGMGLCRMSQKLESYHQPLPTSHHSNSHDLRYTVASFSMLAPQ
jgi:transposase-like protein